MALLAAGRGAAEGDALVEVAVVADHGRLADDDAHAVVDEQPPPDLGARVDLDAGQEPAEVRDQPRQRDPAAHREAVRQAVDDEGVDAGVGEQDFERGARGRVAVFSDLDVFPEAR